METTPSHARARARVSIHSRDLLNLLHNKAESTLPFPARGPGEAPLKVTWTDNTQGSRSATTGQGTRWGPGDRPRVARSRNSNASA